MEIQYLISYKTTVSGHSVEYFIHARNNKLAKYNVHGKGSLVHFTSYTNTLMSEQVIDQYDIFE
jgi:hypothetical protein